MNGTSEIGGGLAGVKLNHNLHAAQSHPTLRNWQSKSADQHSPVDFVLPLFIISNDDEVQPINSMPGVSRMGANQLIKYLSPLLEKGLKSVLLFPVLSGETKGAESALDPMLNPLIKAIPIIKKNFSQLLIITDLCLCTFTSDGHCCVFDDDQRMDAPKSVKLLSHIAVEYAKIGADVIAPSDMMDNRIAGIKNALNSAGLCHVSVLSYAAKFASSLYGPFREAANSAPKFGDRKCYQLPPGSKGLAMRAVARDVEQGADIVMVKPGLAYLDIISNVSQIAPDIPVAVYHVSGEYASLVHAANNGAFDLKAAVLEVMTAFKRAGASIIITYFTPHLLDWLRQ